jgi:hypothetical protein
MFVASMVARINKTKSRFDVAEITLLMAWIPMSACFVCNVIQLLLNPAELDQQYFALESILILPVSVLAAIIPHAELNRRRAVRAPSAGVR